MDRPWDILIIGGVSGAGKTSLSQPLSQQYGIPLVRVDDFQVLLEAITTPEMLPALHYWNEHPNWRDEGVEASVKHLIDVGKMLLPGLKAVVDDHLLENIPMILEGDFILPELAGCFSDKRVKTVFVHEPLQEQILQNFLAREGIKQEFRAAISHVYGLWLAERCAALNVEMIEARPWATLVERVIQNIT